MKRKEGNRRNVKSEFGMVEIFSTAKFSEKKGKESSLFGSLTEGTRRGSLSRGCSIKSHGTGRVALLRAPTAGLP